MRECGWLIECSGYDIGSSGEIDDELLGEWDAKLVLCDMGEC